MQARSHTVPKVLPEHGGITPLRILFDTIIIGTDDNGNAHAKYIG